MTAATNGQQQLAFTGEGDRMGNVRNAGAAHNDRGVPVVHAVPYLAGGVVFGVVGQQELSGQDVPEFLERGEVGQRAILLGRQGSALKATATAARRTRGSGRP